MTAHEIYIYKYCIVQIEQYMAEVMEEREVVIGLDALDEAPLIWQDDEDKCPHCLGECELYDNLGIAFHQCIVCGHEW